MIFGPAANDYEARDGQRSDMIGLCAHAQFKFSSSHCTCTKLLRTRVWLAKPTHRSHEAEQSECKLKCFSVLIIQRCSHIAKDTIPHGT